MTPPQESLEEASSHPQIYPEFHSPTPAGSEMNPEPQGVKESRQLDAHTGSKRTNAKGSPANNDFTFLRINY